MRELFNFIRKSIHWLFFILLIGIAILLIVKNNQFQRSKYLSIAHEITGRVNSVASGIEYYMHLKNANVDLLNRIVQLETEISLYRELKDVVHDPFLGNQPEVDSLKKWGYGFVPASVVYNSIWGTENYIQLDKGAKDGIRADMGVMSPTGIIGVIMEVSTNYSIAISVLNPKFQLNCKIKDRNYFGPLVWDGKNYQYTFLENLPRHAEIEVGDTIVTSGFSAFFPEGLPVGRIIDSHKQKNDNYNSARIQLFADFSTLKNVLIIENRYREERIDLLKTIGR